MELIPIPCADIYYELSFLQPDEATALFNTLLSTCAWEQRKGQFGHTVPRSEAYRFLLRGLGMSADRKEAHRQTHEFAG